MLSTVRYLEIHLFENFRGSRLFERNLDYRSSENFDLTMTGSSDCPGSESFDRKMIGSFDCSVSGNFDLPKNFAADLVL